MNSSESAPSDPTQAVASPVADSSEATRAAGGPDAAASTPTTHDAPAPPQEPAPVRPPRGTLRLTFTVRLEDAHEVLIDLDDTVDFRHGSYQSVAIVSDQIRKVFEAIVAEPLLTTLNQYVRLKLDAGQASPGAVEKPDSPAFPPFPSPPNVAPDDHPFSSPDHP